MYKRQVEDSEAFVQLPIRKSFSEILREYSYTANVVSYIRAYERTTMPPADEGNYSGYYDYSEGDLLKLRYNLEGIRSLAGERRMTVITIPRQNDLMRYTDNRKPNLSADLRMISREIGFEYIDLLPMLHAWSAEETGKFYLECDGHWSAEGHKAGAEAFMILRNR